MPQRTLSKSKTKKATTSGTLETLRQFLQVKLAKKENEKRYGVVRDRVADLIRANGVEDDAGSLFIDPESVGWSDEFKQIKLEKRVSIALDPEVAEELLAKKKLLAKAQTTVTVLDEEKIAALYYQGKISDDEWDELYPQNESWAVKVDGV